MNKPELLNRLAWHKDGIEIDLNKLKDNYELKSNGNKYSLTIKKVQFEDEGKFTVKIRDSDVDSSANLSVTG